MCYCAIGCQRSTLNRLFGCVFLVWRHHLRIIDAHFQTFFSTIFLFLTFLNIHIYFIILGLKTYDQQFTLTTKHSLRIIFKIASVCSIHAYINIFHCRSRNKRSIRCVQRTSKSWEFIVLLCIWSLIFRHPRCTHVFFRQWTNSGRNEEF